jgi:hypothetical protein
LPHNAAEGEIDPRAARASLLGDAVLPVTLGGAAHEQQAPVAELDANALSAAIGSVPEHEGARLT